MAEMQLTLTPQERDLLVRVLTTELKDTRAELHHTDFSVDFRDDVKKEEELLRSLLGKLRAGGTGSADPTAKSHGA
jgi:hypothetical protein